MVSNVTVSVRLFGMTKSLANNQSVLDITMNDAHRVCDLVTQLNKGYPAIGELVLKKKFWSQ